MDADLEGRKDQLTPAQRVEVQDYYMRRYLAARTFAQPERRRSMIAKQPEPPRVIHARHRWPQAWRRQSLT